MGDVENTRIKEAVNELRDRAEAEGYEVFVYVEKHGRWKYCIDMDLQALEKVFSIIEKFYKKMKAMDLLKN